MPHSCSTDEMLKSSCADMHNARKPIPGQTSSQANIGIYSGDFHCHSIGSRGPKHIQSPSCTVESQFSRFFPKKDLFSLLPGFQLSFSTVPASAIRRLAGTEPMGSFHLPQALSAEFLSHSTFISTVCTS